MKRAAIGLPGTTSKTTSERRPPSPAAASMYAREDALLLGLQRSAEPILQDLICPVTARDLVRQVELLAAFFGCGQSCRSGILRPSLSLAHRRAFMGTVCWRFRTVVFLGMGLTCGTALARRDTSPIAGTNHPLPSMGIVSAGPPMESRSRSSPQRQVRRANPTETRSG